MEKAERALVYATVECRQSNDKKVFITRIRALSLNHLRFKLGRIQKKT
jgi:hypothetical protein